MNSATIPIPPRVGAAFTRQGMCRRPARALRLVPTHSIAIRGSGVGQVSGYALLANTGVVSPILTTSNALPHRYRITVDHSNSVNAFVTVERNSGSGYVTVVPRFDVKSVNSGQATVPTIFFCLSPIQAGGSTNFHELGNVPGLRYSDQSGGRFDARRQFRVSGNRRGDGMERDRASSALHQDRRFKFPFRHRRLGV